MPVTQRTTFYCELEDVYALGAPEAALSCLPTDTIDRARAYASDFIDSKLGNQYTVPLTEWAHDVVWCAAALTAARLMGVVGYNPEGSDSIFEKMRAEALLWLDEVARSNASIAGGSKRGPKVLGGPVMRTQPARGW